MDQIEEVIREKSETDSDANEIINLVKLAFKSQSELLRSVDEMKEGVIDG